MAGKITFGKGSQTKRTEFEYCIQLVADALCTNDDCIYGPWKIVNSGIVVART